MNPFYSITNKDNSHVIHINGIIGKDADFAGFRNALTNIISQEPKLITLKINSGGGSMVDGFAMYDMLMTSGCKRAVEVIGIAASMAGVLAQSASPGMLGIHENASWMTHRPQNMAAGESSDLRTMADFADKLEVRAKSIYAKRTGKTVDELKDWFQPGSMKFFNAQECVAAGIADYIITGASNTKPQNRFESEEAAYGFYNTISENTKSKPDMEKVIQCLSDLQIANTLTKQSTDAEVSEAFKNAISSRDAKIKTLEDALKASSKDKATALVENAIKEGKIKADLKDKFIEKATNDFDGVKEVLDGIQGRVDPKMVITGGKAPEAGAGTKSVKTFNQHTEAELKKMKAEDFEGFKALFKAEYGQDWEDSK